MAYTPKHETLTGSNLTGSDGATSRTYTLANDNAILAGMQVLRASAVCQAGTDFSFDSDANTITFLTEVWDDQPITLDYWVTDSTSDGLTYYCNTLQIARIDGIGIEVFSENLGTGDNAEDSFDLNNGNVIANSYTLKHAASGSNSFTMMTEDTHYTIMKDQGLILLTATGITELGSDILYIDYMYSPRHSDTLITTYLPMINAEVDALTGNYWGAEKTSYQYFDGYSSGYPQTDRPYGTQIEDYPEYELRYRSISSITSVKFLDRAGNTDTTLSSDQYRIVTDDDFNESRLLINTSIPNGKMNIKVEFVHGYDSVPTMVQELAALVGAARTLVNISGGSYKDISSYTLGRKTFSFGEVYVNVRESITQIKARIDEIVNSIGFRWGLA